MKKTIFTLSLLSTLLFPAAASAHVRLDPATAVVGRQIYGVRVPNEKDIATTKVRLIVPEGVEITGVLPIPGWTHSETTEAVEHDSAMAEEEEAGHAHAAAEERITEVTWQGGEIKAGEYMVFSINTNYTGDPAKLVWKAYQTYSDGSVVPWDDSNADNPAPTVDVTEETSLETLKKSVADLQAASTAPKDSDFSVDLNTYLAAAAFIVGLGGLIIALKK